MATAFQIRRAAALIRSGGVILYPTDTIYGLGCNPFDPVAVPRIYRLKRRSSRKSLILVAGNMQQLADCIDVEPGTDLTAASPTTWVVPASSRCPPWLLADDGTIAVRVSDHPVISALCDIVESPIVSTSANISGRRPVDNSASIHREFHGLVDAILIDDIHSTGKPSTIKYLDHDHIIRA